MSFLEEKAKRTSKRKNNLYFQQSKANSKKKKSSITSQNMSKRKEENELSTNTRELSCNQREINNNLNEPEAMHALHETQTPASSVGTSPEISNLTDPQISSLSGNGIEIHTIYEEGSIHLTDKDFIQQQIMLLSTPFTLQGCPKLAYLQGNKRIVLRRQSGDRN